MSNSFHTRIALTTRSGNHLRYVPRAFAQALVEVGSAEPERGAGKVRSVFLTRPATAYAQRIGEPTESRASGVRFYRITRLDDAGARVYEHHPRCTILSLDD